MRHTHTSIAAHVSGVVFAVEVGVGALVNRGDALLTIESMKMHCVLESPCAGKLTAILVAPGDVVDEGQAVLVVQESAP